MTELNCSLRSLQIALEPDGVVVARRRKACPLAPPPSIGARSELQVAVCRILRVSVSRARRTEEKRADNAFGLRATTKSAGSSAMREQKDQ
jgi:hypothetical protein